MSGEGWGNQQGWGNQGQDKKDNWASDNTGNEGQWGSQQQGGWENQQQGGWENQQQGGWEKQQQGGWENQQQAGQQGWGNQGGFFAEKNREYKILSLLSLGKCLDLSPGNQNKFNLVLGEYDGKKNQRFWINDQGNGQFSISSAQSGGTVEVPSNTTAKGVQIHVSQPNGTLNEKWSITPVTQGPQAGKNAFFIKSFCGQCLDVCEGKAMKGTKIIQWEYNGGVNQMWRILPA